MKNTRLCTSPFKSRQTIANLHSLELHPCGWFLAEWKLQCWHVAKGQGEVKKALRPQLAHCDSEDTATQAMFSITPLQCSVCVLIMFPCYYSW